jgi:hypothetical protein
MRCAIELTCPPLFTSICTTAVYDFGGLVGPYLTLSTICGEKTYNRRDSQMVTHSSTSRPVQCLCMAERTGCPVFTDLWSYVLESCSLHTTLLGIHRRLLVRVCILHRPSEGHAVVTAAPVRPAVEYYRMI